MKYLRLELVPSERAVHPIDSHLADLAAVTRETILHVDSRGDEMTILYRLTGDHRPLRSALDDHELVLGYDIVEDDDGFSLYVRTTRPPEGSALLDIAHDHALILDTPINVTPDGLRVTLVGTDDDLREAMTALPSDLSITVLKAGPYTPTDRSLLEPLTDRQLEVFRTAVDRGYYELPRRTTHKDLAGELDCSPSTVDEHLRKAEARVVAGLVG